jgi:hypothetical protein
VYASGGRGENAAPSTNICSGTNLLSNAERDLRALGPAELALPGSVEPETVGSTPVSGAWSFSEATAGAMSYVFLLLLAVVGTFAFWRRRRSG